MVYLSAVLAVALVAVLSFFTAQGITGRMTLDLGWGRSLHDLGPIEIEMEAPRDLVFQVIAAPYLGRTPRSMRDHLEVLERGDDYALAAHYTEFSLYTATTVELVEFEEPERVTFTHLRGPVPHADEAFELAATDDGGTTLTYSGELGMDFWGLGSLLARVWVVPTWEDVVRSSLADTKDSAEERARARAERQRGNGEPE